MVKKPSSLEITPEFLSLCMAAKITGFVLLSKTRPLISCAESINDSRAVADSNASFSMIDGFNRRRIADYFVTKKVILSLNKK